MDTYTFLRQFADSWALLAMMLGFLGIVLWTLRPGSRALHRDTARIPLRNDRLPGTQPAADSLAGSDRSTDR
jgi:cytochrome c oxidase cbb3-type subunit IV